MIFASLPVLVVLLALPTAGGDPAPRNAPAAQGEQAAQGGQAAREELVPGPVGVLISVVLIDLAASLTPVEPAPASPAVAVTRLQAAGMEVPAGLDPDQPLTNRAALRLTAAVGLKMTSDRPVDAMFPAGLEPALVRLLQTALIHTQESSE